ncbi:MAG: valine--tRNA ligase [Rhodospirillales bacterium]|nr:valine--tRNA ligase [Rhodospirillales bacterium]MCB9995749.1 valine--tRNA ligase [Rhodospirillales bacterium]
MLEKTFEPEKVESQHYEKWEKEGVFACNPESNNAPFCVMMPPPNVTGSLHMGHALNTTLQDILARYNRMNHKDTLWQPGTDHAGIATQMVVERMLDAEGTSRREMGREAFLDRVWQWKEESGGTIVNQIRKLGATPDWSRERFTMDEGLSKAVRKVFVQLYKEGLIYRDKRLVNWDPKLHTAISDLEVEQKEQKGHMWHIRYPIEGEEERFITVATTRPETMLGDTAIAVHPDDARYKDLVGKFAVLPIANRPIPIVADEYSDPEKGSGAVKITPAHDFNDFEVGKRHDLPMINIFDIDAKINENAPEEYQGLDRFDARKKVLAELEELDLLAAVEDIKHVVPYGDRGGVIIEPFLTEQWYVDAHTLAQPAIEAVRSGKTEFVPKQWENTYYHWMENIQPWCISRQLWWGHQIPAWYGPNGEVYVAETEAEAMAEAREAHGQDVIVERDPDVLDTWFSSALWPFSTLGWPDETEALKKYYPTDTLVTGFDIIFFWVARMMMMGLHFMGDVPFRKVYIHALVRDAKGQKMSKSKGNVIDPLELTDKFGADALRFTLTAMAAQGRDIKLSEDRVEGYRNFATKLWNAARYCQMNNCLPDRSFDPASVQYTPNKWVISEVTHTANTIAQAIENYKFNEAAGAIYKFIWNTFCDWYLEFTKPILAEEKELATEIRQTTGWVLDQILLLLNPFMPFVTEELYASIAERVEEDRLITASWPEYPESLTEADATAEMDWLTRFISEIRSVRADMNVPAGARINLLVKDASAGTQSRLQTYDEILCRMARLEKVELSENEIPKGSIQTVVDEATLILPIADIIDLDQERARLQKEIKKLEDDIKKIMQKLDNEKFISNAPDEVVAEQRTRKEEAEGIINKLSEALKQLEAA